jgi:neutral ceramidase
VFLARNLVEASTLSLAAILIGSGPALAATDRGQTGEGGQACNPIRGERGDDKLEGTAGPDCIRGRGGDDRIRGRAGDDVLVGGPGADRVSAGKGNDLIRVRGQGKDVVDCGAGEDTVHVGHKDRTTNCEKVNPGDPPPTEADVEAGAATADITPPVGTPMFAYTARSRTMNPDPLTDPEAAIQVISDADDDFYAKTFEPSEGIHTRVRASAIVIEREGEKYALVQADLGGVPYALVQEVLEQIASTGIDGEHLLLSASHTHSSTGPIWPADSGGYNLLGGDFFDPRVFQLTADGIAEAIVEADGRLEPAVVGMGSAELRGAANNRNFEPFKLNEEVQGFTDAEAREASLNREVTVLRVDGLDGDPIGLWSNFAVHQTSFGAQNLLISGDNAATTERIVEHRVARESGLGAPVPGPPGAEPGPVLAWTTGAQGDVSPDGSSTNPDGVSDPALPPDRRSETLEWANGSAAGANLAGRKVAEGILAAWRDAEANLDEAPALSSRQTFATFDGDIVGGEPVGPLEALGAGGIVADDGTCAPAEVLPGQGRKQPIIAGVGAVPQTSPVSLWRIGSLAIASYPFEITTQMGRRIAGEVEDAADGDVNAAVIAGLTNGYQSYTATPEEYDACHYEGSFTLFGRQQGPFLQRIAASLAPSVFDSAPAPPSDPEPPPTAIGVDPVPTATATPDAGDAVTQPAATVARNRQATFSWLGGDPGTVDAPRGETLVRLERFVDGQWRLVGTEDGPRDTTSFDQASDAWTETWQFSACDPLGTYRFRVTGMAVRSAGAAPESYAVTSDSFELGPAEPIEVVQAGVSGTTARVVARYPNPGDPLVALPRRVRDGTATITLAGGNEVTATPDANRLGFEAKVPPGASVQSISVTDGCGNSS